MDLDALKQTALEAALEAGELLEKALGTVFQAQTKGSSRDLVTEYDARAQELILARLRARFPEHALLAEENVDQAGTSSYRWLIDPLDGTTNFAHANPVFCVSIAVERAGELLAGVVYAPCLEELYLAVRGRGATLNGAPLHVSAVAALEESLLATGFPYEEDHIARSLGYFGRFARRSQGLRRLGSAALDLCWVAAGRLDGFWEFDLNLWDIAAGRLVVEEAGGRVSDFAGATEGLARGEVVATNGRIHEAMLEVLGEEGA